MTQIINFLGEGIGQARKAPHGHPHGEIRPLDVACRDVSAARIARDRRRLCAKANRRTIAAFRLRSRAVQLGQRSVIHVTAECALNGVQIDAVSVRCELHAIGKATRHVLHEVVGALRIAGSDKVGDGQLGICINRRPCPSITVSELPALFLRHVLLLCVAELPDFIALNPARFHAAHCAVVKLRARRPHVFQEREDCALGDASHAAGGANRIAFHKGVHNGDLLGER